MKINRIFTAFFLISILILSLGGCGRRSDGKKAGVNILCTVYPVWLLTANVADGINGVNLDLLLPSDASPHASGLRPRDMQKIADADIIVLNGYGVEFELQIANAIKQENPKALQIIASEGVKPLFYGEEAEADEHVEEHEGHEHKSGSQDPHTWVSPKQAIILVKNIRDGLAKADPAHAEDYRSNADRFVEQLESLVVDFENTSRQFTKHDIVTGHMAFGYLARDFGLNIVAVIEVIPHQEPSASELLKLSEKIRNSGAVAIFTEPIVRSGVSKTLGDATGLPVRTLHPCHMGNMDKDEYILNMKENLEELKNALM